MNINGYVPILINTFDTIVVVVVVVGNFADLVTTNCGDLLHAAGEYCILLML